ncbi:MAG: carboxypeptidase regulatory-like domain-containing protein [Candidatus Eremiobacteraeota bacterium]|nr:carboxypeptidase regulatory-like domain-containing protein [Candidatus Eremiobacteraeota bacterium]
MNLVVCLILTLAALSPAPEIAGTVADDKGKSVSGVPIFAVSIPSSNVIQKTVSESDGSFRFTGLASGSYGVEAETRSACAFSDAIQVDTGFTTAVHLRLVPGLCQHPLVNSASGPRALW